MDVEGDVLGDCEGEVEGEVLGDRDGDVDGLVEGLVDGDVDGLLDGLVDGEPEGLVDGDEPPAATDLNTTALAAYPAFKNVYVTVLVPAVASAME